MRFSQEHDRHTHAKLMAATLAAPATSTASTGAAAAAIGSISVLSYVEMLVVLACPCNKYVRTAAITATTAAAVARATSSGTTTNRDENKSDALIRDHRSLNSVACDHLLVCSLYLAL